MGVMILRRTLALCAALAFGLAAPLPTAAQPVVGPSGEAGNAGSNEVARQATELNDRGEKLYEQGDYDGALPLLAEALRLGREALGERHPDTITILSNYAVALSSAGRLEEAEPLLAEALRLNREVLGETHADTLFSLNNYAYVLIELGRANEADPLFVEALRLHRETLGERHPETLNSINGYAGVLYSLGRMKEAEPLFAEALRLRREELGERHPDTITSLNNYAVALQALGRMDEAEPLYSEALRLRRDVLGERHPDTLSSLSVYASALHLLGRWQEAEPLYAEALSLFREEVGERHPFTITTLNNYAIVLELLGRMDQAEPLFAETLRLRREVQGERHPATLTTLNNYAGVLRAMGRAAEAEPLSAEALRVRRETLGERHPDTLQSLNNYAFVQLALGRAEQAEPLFAEALRLRRDVLGDRHPITLSSFRNYAHVLQVTGRPAEALPISRLLVSAYRARAVDLAALGVRGSDQRLRERSERELIERSHADVLWANFAAAQSGQSELEVEAFTGLQLASAGSTTPAVAEAAAARFAASVGLQGLAEERKALAQRWTALDERLVRAQSGGDDRAALRETIRTDIRAVEARIAEIDAQLAVEAPQYSAILNQQAVGLQELRRILGEDEAVLFLVPTDLGTHSMAVTREAIRWHRADPNRSQVAETVKRFREGLEVKGEFLPAFDLVLAHQLYVDLVEPVEVVLNSKKRVYAVADGALSRLPLGTLVASAPTEGADTSDPEVLRRADWLADRYALVQLPSLQSLVFIRGFSTSQSEAEAVFSGFGAPALLGRAATRGARSPTIAPIDASTLVEPSNPDPVLQLMNPDALRRLAALPGTRQELERVRDALHAGKASLFLGPAMTEAAIRTADLSQSTILHLATHAFTSEDAGSLAEPGLVFTPPEVAQPLDDGYLAASEVIGINLTSADWVILSACNTAAPSGEAGGTGLSGLAQAFFYAGAQSMLVSHWPVFDDIAPELVLKTLSLSQSGLPRAEAFQRAMREVRNDPRIDASHPAIWAPFVLVGEGR